MERNEERLYKIVKEKIINELMKVGSRRRSEMIYQEMLEEIRDRIRIFGKESEDKWCKYVSGMNRRIQYETGLRYGGKISRSTEKEQSGGLKWEIREIKIGGKKTFNTDKRIRGEGGYGLMKKQVGDEITRIKYKGRKNLIIGSIDQRCIRDQKTFRGVELNLKDVIEMKKIQKVVICGVLGMRYWYKMKGYKVGGRRILVPSYISWEKGISLGIKNWIEVVNITGGINKNAYNNKLGQGAFKELIGERTSKGVIWGQKNKGRSMGNELWKWINGSGEVWSRWQKQNKMAIRGRALQIFRRM